ncbi:MYND finger domain-containing protein [Cardiosporidium cionae]|uniref:MYND finger domain-containing protein n=1 Tax=Cardiosporidium cionae TaxID=476202 RepID=A0ABQ7JFH8_9APIC|nr:MYND finger domain-containing protein [Cardiosporidium cionae]|eukprot:KAF8822770.1 MYND finger domain-containing protein [Cardiosporidium cionae]
MPDINEEVKLLSFTGTEGDFRAVMKSHFQRDILPVKNKEDFKKTLKDGYSSHSFSSDYLDSVVTSIQTYQIIPLSLPSQRNGFEGINCYIDDIGRIKQLEVNSRATRICSTERNIRKIVSAREILFPLKLIALISIRAIIISAILAQYSNLRKLYGNELCIHLDIRGDCFISKTFDNDDIFERRNFSLGEYESMLKIPLPSKNRWSQQETMTKLLQSQGIAESEQSTSVQNPTLSPTLCCSNCGIEDPKAGKDRNSGLENFLHGRLLPLMGAAAQEATAPKLKHCGNCHKVAYCSRACQKSDWKLHRRLCQKPELSKNI